MNFKKTPLFVLAIASMMAMAACGNTPSTSSSGPAASSSPAQTSSPAASSAVSSATSEASSEEASSLPVESSSQQSQASSSERSSEHTVTFVYYDGTTEEIVVSDGETVASKTDGTVPSEGYIWLGWYFGTSEYDFSAPVTSDVYLISTCRSYADIPATLSVEIPESHTFADGEFLQGGNVYVGHYMEILDTNKYPHQLFSTFKGFTVSTYELFDGKGNKVGDVKPGDKITLSDTEMTLIPKKENSTGTVSFAYEEDATVDGEGSLADFASVEHSASKEFWIPDTKLAREGYVFVGWQIEDLETENKETFLPGECISASDMMLYGTNVTFTARFISEDDLVEVSSWDDLVDAEAESILSLTADIDADGADTADGGIGGEEWCGTILGNGYTISNFHADEGDSSDYGGLINLTDGFTEIFNLNLDQVELYATANWGTGALIGEADYDTVIKNVSVDNVKLVAWDSYYSDSSACLYGNTGVGAVVGYSYDGSLIMDGVSVSNFDTSEATPFDYTIAGAEPRANTPEVGGIVGEVYGSNKGGFKMQFCSVSDSKILVKEDSSAVIGGMVAKIDGPQGVELWQNSVTDTTVEAKDMNYRLASPYYMDAVRVYAGGFYGDMEYTNTYREIGKIHVPSEILNNHVDADVSVSFVGENSKTVKDEEDSSESTASWLSIAYAGGFAGQTALLGRGDAEKAGKDEDGNTIWHATWAGCANIGANMVEGRVAVKAENNSQKAWFGGFMGYLDTDCGSYGYVYVENNYVDVATKYENANIGSDNGSEGSAFIGSFCTESSSGVFFYSDVIMGSLDTPNGGDGVTIGGLIGDGFNEDADNFFNYIFIGATFTAETYGSCIGNYIDDPEEAEYASSTFGDHIMVDNKVGVGSVGASFVKGIDVSAEHSAVEQAQLEKDYFASDENGYPVYAA